MQQFKDLKTLLAYFSDEKVAWNYLEEQLWHGKPVCPHCGSEKVYRLSNYKQFKCSNKATCDKKFTVTVGTIYQNTRIPLSTWFAAIYLSACNKKGISSHQLARYLSVTQRTAWHLLHRIREMVKVAADVQLDTNVSIDETYVKGKPANRTKYQKKLIAEGKRLDEPTIVLGMVQKDSNAVFKVVPNAEISSIKPIIYETIQDASTTIVTDAYSAYDSIGEAYDKHVSVNHSMGEWKKDGFSTNNAEGAFSWFKRTIYGTYHYVSPKHFQSYCNLFTYRFNTRKIKDFERFIDVTKKGQGRLTYRKLIKKA